jgi:hypothetical protein
MTRTIRIADVAGTADTKKMTSIGARAAAGSAIRKDIHGRPTSDGTTTAVKAVDAVAVMMTTTGAGNDPHGAVRSGASRAARVAGSAIRAGMHRRPGWAGNIVADLASVPGVPGKYPGLSRVVRTRAPVLGTHR